MKDKNRQEGIRRQQLFLQGRFDLLIASIDRDIAEDPDDAGSYRERAQIYLILGHLQKARSDFDFTQRLEQKRFQTKPDRLQSDNEIAGIGVTYWMEGYRELAIAFWRYATSSLLNNHVSYSSAGGGIETGLLLWFGAAYERSQPDVELVSEFYKQRLASKFWSHSQSNWPGPIIRFFLEEIDGDTLLELATEYESNLCNANLALSIRARENRRYSAAKKYLKAAACGDKKVDIYDFFNVWSFFLARFEIGEIEVQ